jgi:hypothetical protein
MSYKITMISNILLSERENLTFKKNYVIIYIENEKEEYGF